MCPLTLCDGEKRQINPRHPGSESLRRMHLVKEEEEEESTRQLFIFWAFICSLQQQQLQLQLLFWSPCSRAETQPGCSILQSLHHLHLNNKLKAVKFRHCDYQCNYIIELKTETSKLHTHTHTHKK